MSTEAGPSTAKHRLLEPIAMASSWQAFRFKTAIPLSPEDRPWFVSFMEHFTDAVARIYRLQPSLWLDTAELHRDGGARLFSSHARQWSPTMGFAFDPAGPSRRTLQFSDLAEATYGTPPKIFDRSAIFVSALEETQPAYRLLAGRGLATLLFFPSDDPSGGSSQQAIRSFMANSKQVLEPLITSAMFRHHPFYLPLLSSKSSANASGQQLESWLGGAQLLWRENFEDGEMLLLSPHDLAPVFSDLGMSRLSPAEGAVPWSVNTSTMERAANE